MPDRSKSPKGGVKIERIASSVWHVHVPGKTLPPYDGTECYWVGASDDRVILIDSGDGSPAAQEALRQSLEDLGKPTVQAIYITHYHPDHAGGAFWAQETFGAPVYAHTQELDRIRQLLPHCVCTPFDGGLIEVGSVGVQAFCAPGHTSGQLNFWIEAEGCLLAGDNVLGRTTTVIIPPDGNLRVYQSTLAQLLQLNPRVIGPGHGPLVTDGVRYLREYIQHRQEREQEVLRLLGEGLSTVEDIAARIYANQLPKEKLFVGVWMVQGHLEALQNEGRIIASSGRFRLAEPGKNP